MAHHVRILPSGDEITVERGESILTAAWRQGVQLPYGCRSGRCAACMGELHCGAVEYPEGEPPTLTAAGAGAGHTVLCQAEPTRDCTIEIRTIEEGDATPVRTLAARLVEAERLAHDVVRLWIRLPAGERLRFRPGQYVDLLLRDGRRRSYSLANPPQIDDRLELHVRQVQGGHFSEHLLGGVQSGALLRFEGPLGSFYLREGSTRPLILVAGGTGFAPIKSMVEHALACGDERPLHLFWGVRTQRDLYQGELAQSWARDHAHVAFTPVLSEPADEGWDGATGYVHAAVLKAYPDLSGHDVYMAGPPAMIAAARADFAHAGLPAQALYFDSFDYAPKTADANSPAPSE